MAYQPSIVSAVIGLTNFGCGASLMRGMLDLLKQVYKNGDFTKLQSEFFEQILPLMQNQKATSHVKVAYCYLSSKVFKVLGNRCHTPPTKELIDCYFKIAKTSQDKFTKECAFKAIKQIIKSNPSNLFQMSSDLFKHIIKLVNSDKTADVKADVVTCLRVYVQCTLNYTSMHQIFDQVLQASIKGLEDSNQRVQEQFILTLYYLLNQRLQESYQQGDVKTPFKIFNQQQREALQGKDKKKSSQVFYDVPRTLAEMISFLCAILFRIQSTPANQQQMDILRQALGQVMGRLIETNRMHLELLEPENILSPLLLCLISKSQPNQNPQANTQFHELDIFKQRELSVWVICQALQFYEKDQKMVILKHSLQCLLKKQLIMNKESLDIFQGFSKNQKVTTLLNESQIITLLRVANEVIFRLQPLELKKNFQNEKELIDPILPLIKESSSNTIRLYAVEVVKTLGYKCPHIIHELISIFLSLATITNADITTLKQIPYHIFQIDKSQQKPESTKFQDTVNNLTFTCYGLGCLISSINTSLGGIPLALVNQTINVAKGMILGNWKVGEDEDEFYFSNDLNKLDLQENQRREGGWFIFEGLVQLGNQWMGTKLSLFFKLLNSVFSKDMCVVNPIQIKDQRYCEKILNEFKIKKAALSTLKTFLDKSFILLNNQLLKLVSSFLTNAVSFFINHDKEKREINKLFASVYPTEYSQVKIDLYQCLLAIPSGLFQSKFVNILHTVCEEIVSDEIQNPPSIHKTLLHFEDKVLLSKGQRPLRKFISQENLKSLKIDKTEELCQNESLIQLFRFDKPLTQLTQKNLSLQKQLLNSSILIFAEIFASSHLNPKNKQQLIKHFISHSQNQSQIASKKDKSAQPVPVSEQKINKVIAITLCLLQVCKIHAKRNDQIDQELETQIRTVFKNCDSYSNLILLRISAEGYAFINIPSILKDPTSKLEGLIREQDIIFQQLTQNTQQDEWLKKTKIVCILGNLARYLDYETILAPSMKMLLDTFMKLSKENNNTIREHFLHFSEVLVKRVGNEYQEIFNQIFPACFHLTQTDIKTNWLVLNSLGAIVQFNMRQNFESAYQMRRSQIVIKEFITLMFLRDEKASKDQKTLLIALDLIKTTLIFDVNKMAGYLEAIISKILNILSSQDLLNLKIKMKTVEILATLIYKGYFNYIRSTLQTHKKQDLLVLIQNLANTSLELGARSFSEEKILKKIQEPMESIMNYNDEFEKLINIQQCWNFDNEKMLSQYKDKKSIKSVIFRYACQVLYVKSFKIQAALDFKEGLEFVKSTLIYSHTSQASRFEESKKVGEKQGESANANPAESNKSCLSFQMNEEIKVLTTLTYKTFLKLYGEVDSQHSQRDLRKYLGQLISLSYTLITDDSIMLKKVGFSIVLTLVRLFKYTIEKIGDDDDDASNKMQIYKNNPLLLEQFEAQIFSIIRQNVQITSAKLIDPYIVMKNYKLIYYYLTLPISRDPTQIQKIINMLFDNIKPNLQIFNSAEMLFHEKAITDMHFKKLTLLSKLLITSVTGIEYEPLNNDLSNFECDDIFKNLSVDNKKWPSKFLQEDRERLLEIFTQNHLQILVKHIQAAIQDGLMIITMPKSSIKSIKDLTFIFKNGSRSAYVQETIERSVQCFIQTITILLELENHKKIGNLSNINEDQQKIIHALITFYLSKDIIQKNRENDQQDNETNFVQKAMIYSQIQLKLSYLSYLNKLLADNKLALQSKEEVEQYLRIAENLEEYGVIQINHQLVILYSRLYNFQSTDLCDELINRTVGILAQIQPEIIGRSRLSQEYQKCELELIKCCIDFLVSATNQSTAIFKKIFTFITYRLTITLASIKNKSVIKYYATQIIGFVAMLKSNQTSVKESISNESLVEMITQISFSLNSAPQSCLQFGFLILLNLVCLIQTDSSRTQILGCFDQIFNIEQRQIQSLETSILMLKLVNQALQKEANDTLKCIAKYLFGLALTNAFEKLKTLEDEPKLTINEQQFLQEIIGFLMNVYSGVLTNEQRQAGSLSQMMLLVFTIIQNRNLEAGFRNSQAELIFKLFQIDQIAFKAYLLSPDTTLNEKQLIEKIIKQFAVLAATGGLNKGLSNAPPQTQQTSSFQQAQNQVQDTSIKGKIQLTMSFNKK